MKQTAVEWLGNEITSRITRRNPHDTIIIQTQGEILIELIEQAKAMEKEQVIDSYHKGQLSVLDVLEKVLTPMGFDSTSYKEDKEDANEYYKQTFK